MNGSRFDFGRRLASLAFALMTLAAACDDPVSTDDPRNEEPRPDPAVVALTGNYVLSEVAGGPLPYVVTNPACTLSFRNGTLTLSVDRALRTFELRGSFHSDCPGAGPTLTFNTGFAGRWTLEGETIHFLRERTTVGHFEEVARGHADRSSISVRGLLTSWEAVTADEVYRRQ
jgi:hypothetical protein